LNYKQQDTVSRSHGSSKLATTNIVLTFKSTCAASKDHLKTDAISQQSYVVGSTTGGINRTAVLCPKRDFNNLNFVHP
jgi:hypothetical protein